MDDTSTLSSDVIIIDCDQGTIPRPIKKTKKTHRKKTKREVIFDQTKEEKTLVITQKVEIEKQTIKCIIKLNSNKHQNKHTNTEDKMHVCKADRAKNIQRVVPTCHRLKCQDAVKSKINTKIKSNKLHHQKHSQRKKAKRKQLRKHGKKPKVINGLNKCLQNKWDSLSSISLSPIKTGDISYDDISLDSFSCYSDNEIDTLIKRTKEREQKCYQSAFCLEKPIRSSTPKQFILISSDDEDSTDVKYDERSIHSLATIVLESTVDDIISSSPSEEFRFQSRLKCQEDVKNDISNNSYENIVKMEI